VKKTNAARHLDQIGFSYRLVEYPFDEEDLGAASVAEKIGMPLDRVYKTLVARGDKTGVFLAVIPGDSELDLKSVAALTGNKKCDLVHLKGSFPPYRLPEGRSLPSGFQETVSRCYGRKRIRVYRNIR
jgi:Uncharacterized conserved protein